MKGLVSTIDIRGHNVPNFTEESVSEKAGLKVEDVRIQLFYKKEGETLRVRVIRKRFLLGSTEKEFEVTL